MKTIRAYLPFLLLSAIAVSGCRKSAPVQPENAILGKWELVEMGAGDGNMNPFTSNEYLEYLPDGTMRVYDQDKNRFTSETGYWLKDSILYEGTYVDDEFHGVRYKYRFFDNNNKLRLEFHEMTAIVPVAIYKRIK